MTDREAQPAPDFALVPLADVLDFFGEMFNLDLRKSSVAQ
jgi:hypothetical protein